MRAPAYAILSMGVLAPFAACGPSGTGQSPGVASSSGTGSGGSGTPSSNAEGGGSGSPIDASSPLGADSGTENTERSDSSTIHDASLLDGGEGGSAAGDGGVPYKGVANSACADLVRLGATWYYNWTLSPGSCTSS